jgi:hypothetical protein
MLHKLSVFIDQMNYCVERNKGKTTITHTDLALFHELHAYIRMLETKCKM